MDLDLVFGWAALLSAVATIGTFATAILFFAVGGAAGKVNDAVSVVQAALMLPVAAAMALLTYPVHGGLAWLALVVGGAGTIVAAVLQALLVVGAVRFERTIGAVLSAGVAMGLWLIVANALAVAGAVLAGGLGASGIVAGAGYLLSAIGFYRGGQQHALFYAGGGLVVAGYAVWATWLGRLLLAGALL